MKVLGLEKRMSKIIQFNWRRHWKKKVEPNLEKELVQACLDGGMRMLDEH